MNEKKKLHYYIEQADNGAVIADRTDCEEGEYPLFCEVALEKDIRYQLGKYIYDEIYNFQNSTLANAVGLEITIKARKSKL